MFVLMFFHIFSDAKLRVEPAAQTMHSNPGTVDPLPESPPASVVDLFIFFHACGVCTPSLCPSLLVHGAVVLSQAADTGGVSEPAGGCQAAVVPWRDRGTWHRCPVPGSRTFVCLVRWPWFCSSSLASVAIFAGLAVSLGPPLPSRLLPGPCTGPSGFARGGSLASPRDGLLNRWRCASCVESRC